MLEINSTPFDRIKAAQILVIDDIADNVQFLEYILKEAGCRSIISTTDSREALSLYQKWQPDIVLLDWMMPHLSGFEVMKQLRAIVPHEISLPILVLTADTSKESRQKALRYGANDFLAKPFDYSEVVLRIDNLLKMRFLYCDIQRQQAQLEILSLHLIDAQERERRHVARELHDEIGQALTAVKITLQGTQRLPALQALPDEVAHLRESIGIVDHAITQVRDLSFMLRPSMLDDFGLIDTLEWCVERAATRGRIKGHFSCDGFDACLSPALETTCFRITQEALTNVLRHAQAQHIEVQLRQCEGLLNLIISDDGCGFNVENAQQRALSGASMGVLNMEERARLAGGQLEIHSALGEGTQIHLSLPLTHFSSSQSHLDNSFSCHRPREARA